MIDATHNVIWTVLHGDLGADMLRHAATAIAADADYRRAMDLYVDCRVLTRVPSEDEIRALAIELLLRKQTQTIGRIAIVVLTRLGLRSAEVLELFSDARDPHVAVFTAHGPALAWLGLSCQRPEL